MERALVAAACRVLVARGLADGLLGHVSLRVDDDHLLVRCRGPEESGLGRTLTADVRLLTFDGREAAPGELADGYTPPNELPLHTAVLRARGDVGAVVHAHPAAVVALDLAGRTVEPIVGAFDIPGTSLARGGVPVFTRGVLVRDRLVATEMVAAMENRPVVVLRGHGLTSAGSTVQRAMLQAISVDRIARLTLAILAAGGQPVPLASADLDDLPNLGDALNEAAAWRHELARLNTAPLERDGT
jgi:3,4-dihydroxyphthalate decarboxylase